ncbi:MAG: hypothetical protein ACRD15_07155 [Vicinamibacterales bacterium]
MVGVAEPTRHRELAKACSTFYLPANQFLNTARMLVVRSTASLNVIASLSRQHVRAFDPDVQVIRVAPFSQLLDAPLARPWFNAWLVGIFAIAALFLATVGELLVDVHRQIGIQKSNGLLDVATTFGPSYAVRLTPEGELAFKQASEPGSTPRNPIGF